MSRQLSSEEQHQLHHRYRKNDLFRHWSPILCQQEWERQELDVNTIWWESEKLLQQLRQELDARDEMIPYLFKSLIVELKTIEQDGKATLIRTEEQAELSAVTVMCVLMTRLMNAVEEGHEEEDFDNLPMCVAIANILRNHPHFQLLMDRFLKRKLGNDGKKIVITPSDPMHMEKLLDDMDEEARKEVELMQQTLMDKTAGLQSLFGEYWDCWRQLCKRVCMDLQLLQKLKAVNPGNNEWGVNQKLICNIIGLFRDAMKIRVSWNAVNAALSEKQLRSYLRNHSDYKGSDADLNAEQHRRIVAMIPKKDTTD